MSGRWWSSAANLGTTARLGQRGRIGLVGRIGGLAGLALAAAWAAAPAPARAEPAPGGAAEADERLAGCDALPERARLARLEPVGADALFAVARAGERYLVFPREEGRECAVYPLGRAAARAAGRFGGSATELCAIQPPRCAAGSCPIALVLRGPGAAGAAADRPLAALRLDASCDEGVALAALKLFPGRDSAELVCRAASGAGWRERRVLLDAAGGALAPLYSLDTGSYAAPSPEEKARGACPARPIGSIRVERVGARPLLRVVDPAAAPAGALRDGRGTLPARQLAYDPARRAFAPTGKPDLAAKVDARAGCARR